jgi:hypothetical protein
VATDRIEGETTGMSTCGGDFFIDGVILLAPTRLG